MNKTTTKKTRRTFLTQTIKVYTSSKDEIVAVTNTRSQIFYLLISLLKYLIYLKNKSKQKQKRSRYK